MLRSIKVLVLVFVLGVFALPKQLVFAQTTIEKCCKEESSTGCCEQPKKDDCHTESSNKSSQHEDCGNDCSNCKTCSVNIMLLSAVPPADFQILAKLHTTREDFSYKSPFFTTQIQNIWQPPKLV